MIWVVFPLFLETPISHTTILPQTTHIFFQRNWSRRDVQRWDNIPWLKVETMESPQEQFHGEILAPLQTNMTSQKITSFLMGDTSSNWVFFYCHLSFRGSKWRQQCKPTEIWSHNLLLMETSLDILQGTILSHGRVKASSNWGYVTCLVPTTMVSMIRILLKVVLGHLHQNFQSFWSYLSLVRM